MLSCHRNSRHLMLWLRVWTLETSWTRGAADLGEIGPQNLAPSEAGHKFSYFLLQCPGMELIMVTPPSIILTVAAVF